MSRFKLISEISILREATHGPHALFYGGKSGFAELRAGMMKCGRHSQPCRFTLAIIYTDSDVQWVLIKHDPKRRDPSTYENELNTS